MSFFAVNPRVYAAVLAVFAFAFLRRLVVQWRTERARRRDQDSQDRTRVRDGGR